VLLEAHGDFDRDLRGDSLHPAIMQVLDELGLADQLLALPHRKLRQATLPASPPITIDLSRLPGRFPYITLMPQAQFLEFLSGGGQPKALVRSCSRPSQVSGLRYKVLRSHSVVGPPGSGCAGCLAGGTGQRSARRAASVAVQG
jgi:hypothetical protein